MSVSRSLQLALCAGLFGLVSFASDILAAEPLKLDNYGDPLPPGAIVRLGTTRLEAAGGFVWMPDGQSLVTARGGALRFWDVPDGRPGLTFAVPLFGAFRHYLARSADGSKVVCTDQYGQPCVWDLKAVQFVVPPEIDTSERRYVNAVAMAPDGSKFVTLTSGKLRWFDSSSCRLERCDELAFASTRPVVFSPDGKRLAVANSRSIQLMDVDHLKEPIVVKDAHEGGVNYFAFTHDGKRLVSSGIAKPQRRTLPDGTTSTTTHSQIRVWDVAEQRLLVELPLDESLQSGCAIAIAPDDRTVVAVHDDRIEIWDLSTQALVRTIGNIEIRNPVWAWVAVESRGKYVAVADNQASVRIWDLATGQPHLGHDRYHHWTISQLTWSPDSRLIATGGHDKEVRLWNAATGEMIRSLGRPTGWISGLAFFADGRRLAVGAGDIDQSGRGYDGTLRAFDVASGTLLFQRDLGDHATNLRLSKDGKRLAVASGQQAIDEAVDPGITFFDAESSGKLGSVKTSPSELVDICWSADDKVLLTLGGDNSVRRFNVEAGAEIGKLDVPHERQHPREDKLIPAAVMYGAFLGESSVLTTSSTPPEIHCWDLASGRKTWTIKVAAQAVRRLTVSPDGRIMAAVCTLVPHLTYRLQFWETATQRELMMIEIPSEAVYSAVFSPDGRRIATGFEGGTALVWDVSEAWKKLEIAK